MPLGENLEVWRLQVTNRRRKAARLSIFSSDRVLPVGRAGRRHQLPAQLQHRPGRGRRRRHLPQDRVPRAPRPLRLLRLLGAAGRLRHAARRVPRPVPRLGPAGGRRAGQGHGLDRARLAADGLAPRQARSRARRDARGHLRARLPREPADEKFDPPGSQTINKKTVKPVIAAYLEPATVDDGLRGLRDYWDGLLGIYQVQSPDRARQPHGQHLERLPVHGHVQHVALGVVLRIGHRPRPGLPRLEPGPARLRAHGARARPRAHPRPRRDAAARPAAPTTSTSR